MKYRTGSLNGSKEGIALTETLPWSTYEQCQECFSPNDRRAITCPCGPKPCDVMIIGQAPSFDLKLPPRRDTLKHSRTARLLRKRLEEIGQNLDDFYFTNLIKCSSLTENKEGNQANCYEKLRKEIEEVMPKRIIVLGTKAKKVLKNKQDLVEKYRIQFIYHPAQRKLSHRSYCKQLEEALKT